MSTQGVSGLLKGMPNVVSMGLASFTASIASQGARALHVEWAPPAGGDPAALEALDSLLPRAEMIRQANDRALQMMQDAQPVLVDIRPAREVIPGMSERTILHAGPPIAWEAMCGPIRGAVAGALVYEGKAADVADAERLAGSGKIIFSPCHHHCAVGPMAGVISPSMPVFCVRNETAGNMAYATLNEGLGKVLRFGANGPEVIARLKWMAGVLAPSLAKALKIAGGINIKNLIAQALLMGDECHNRNVAGTGLFLRAITPHLLAADVEKETTAEIFRFIAGNDHFFLNLAMPACKAAADTVNVAVEGYMATPRPEKLLLHILNGFLLTFASVRLVTWAIREGHGPFRNVSVSGRHIHHFVPGILVAFMSGIGGLMSENDEVEDFFAFTLGSGMGLTFDEAALLLDLEDPTIVCGQLTRPLLTPSADERAGYVPNVVYSCGGMLHGRTLVLPYGCSDSEIRIALVDVDALVAELLSGR